MQLAHYLRQESRFLILPGVHLHFAWARLTMQPEICSTAALILFICLTFILPGK